MKFILRNISKHIYTYMYSTWILKSLASYLMFLRDVLTCCIRASLRKLSSLLKSLMLSHSLKWPCCCVICYSTGCLQQSSDSGGQDGVFVYEPHARPIKCLTFDPWNNQHLYSASYDGTLRCCHLDQAAFTMVGTVFVMISYNGFYCFVWSVQVRLCHKTPGLRMYQFIALFSCPQLNLGFFYRPGDDQRTH